jgi:hypothetical protein
MRFLFPVVMVGFLGPLPAAEPELVSVKMIWDAGKHNAFTDLVRFKDAFLCTFREGDAHVGGDGKCRILISPDGDTWTPLALVEEKGIDLRDPKLSVTPDGRLMLVAGGSVYEGKTFKGRQPRVAFSADEKTWTPTKRVLGDGDWLWRVTWHDKTCYGVTYAVAADKSTSTIRLVKSSDGEHYTDVANLAVPDKPGEATVRFRADGMMVALVRREGGNQHGWVGSAKAPYIDWSWKELDYRLGGPEFLILPTGEMWAGTRLHEKGSTKTTIGKLTLAAFEPKLTLATGGDTSYPGMVWHDNLIWTSFYSSHDGKAKIYLAKVRLK